MASEVAGVCLVVAALLMMTAIYASTFWRAESLARSNEKLIAKGLSIAVELDAMQLAYAELERNYLTCINADECNDLRKQLQQSQLVCNAYREQIDAMKLEWAEMSDRLGTVVKGVAGD